MEIVLALPKKRDERDCSIDCGMKLLSSPAEDLARIIEEETQFGFLQEKQRDSCGPWNHKEDEKVMSTLENGKSKVGKIVFGGWYDNNSDK